MENILYLDDYINLYNIDCNKIIVYKPYKNSLNKGRIINKDKFIKIYNKMLKEYNLNNKIFGSNIRVILNKNIYEEDKNILINVLENLNYKNIVFTKEDKYLKISKNDLYIIYNYTYFYIYYMDNLGNIKTVMYELNDNIKLFLSNILESYQKKNIYIYGKNYQELKNILDKEKIDYYYFYDSDNLIIKIILNDKFV